MSKFTCPYCYAIHDVKSSGLKCSYTVKDKNTGLITKTCIGTVVKDSNGWIPADKKKECLKCKSARKAVYCNEAEKEIPTDFLNGESLSVALIGAKASGKSNYIGVLVNEIRKKMTASFNCTLSLTASEESKKYYDDHYYKPLFRDGYVVAGTSQSEYIPPLIFPLRFMDNKNRVKKVAALSFYDTAGENLNDTRDIIVNNRYIPNADGIILLLDPLQVPAIRDQLAGKVPLPEKNTDAVEILDRIVQNIRDVKNIKGTIKTPLALAFTKIDALEGFDILPQGSCLFDESEHLKRGVFVKTDFEAVNMDMETILGNFLGDELGQKMKEFEKVALFGLSSLGGVPNGTKLSTSIKPRRVLDPLLWLLAENNYIKIAKK